MRPARRVTAAATALAISTLLPGCPPGVGSDPSLAFRDLTAVSFDPVPFTAGWSSLAVFDYDNDADLDIFITCVNGLANRLYQNDGTGQFTDVAAAAGVRFSTDNGVCTGIGDFDNDGWLDLLIGRQIDVGADESTRSIRYLKNLGADETGTVRFVDATENAGLEGVDFVTSIGVGDFDNDGLLDLYLGRYDFRDLHFSMGSQLPDTPNVMLRNTGVDEYGVPVFDDVTEAAGVAGTRIAGLAPETADLLHRIPTWSVYVTDVDADGRQDVFSLQEVPGGVDLFMNRGDMTFELSHEELLNKRGGWMGVASADYDQDGDVDYFLANVGADAIGERLPHVTSAWAAEDGSPYHRFLRNDGGLLTDVAPTIEVEPGHLPPINTLRGQGLAAYEFAFGCAFTDIDLDGFPDLAWTGDIVFTGLFRVDFHGVSRLLRNLGDGSLADVSNQRGFHYWSQSLPLEYGHSKPGRALAAIDVTGDGADDICRTSNEAEDNFQLLVNPGVQGHWLTVRLTGTESNRFGIGARVTIKTGDTTRAAEVVTTTSAFTAVHPQASFGLGDVDRVDELNVYWPSGTVTTVSDVTVDRVLTITE